MRWVAITGARPCRRKQNRLGPTSPWWRGSRPGTLPPARVPAPTVKDGYYPPIMLPPTRYSPPEVRDAVGGGPPNPSSLTPQLGFFAVFGGMGEALISRTVVRFGFNPNAPDGAFTLFWWFSTNIPPLTGLAGTLLGGFAPSFPRRRRDRLVVKCQNKPSPVRGGIFHAQKLSRTQ